MARRLDSANSAGFLWDPEADLVSGDSRVDLAPSGESIGARLPILGHSNIVLLAQMWVPLRLSVARNGMLHLSLSLGPSLEFSSLLRTAGVRLGIQHFTPINK